MVVSVRDGCSIVGASRGMSTSKANAVDFINRTNVTCHVVGYSSDYDLVGALVGDENLAAIG